MKKTILVAVIGALTLSVNAGTWSGKGVAPKNPPVEECLDLGGNIGVGYHTDYIFRGARLARDTVSANVNYTYDGLAIPVTLGVDYFNGINNDTNGLIDFDMLHMFVDFGVGTFAGFDVNLRYTHHVFPEIRSNLANTGLGFGEIGLTVGRSLGFADLVYGSSYAMGGLANGWFHHLGLSRGFELTDSVSLVLAAGVAYSDNYWQSIALNRDSGWNHYYLTASLPIQLNCRTVLTPYIGYTGAPNTWVVDGADPYFPFGAQQSDILHGGVTLSVSF
jgi:hypothetical protein